MVRKNTTAGSSYGCVADRCNDCSMAIHDVDDDKIRNEHELGLNQSKDCGIGKDLPSVASLN